MRKPGGNPPLVVGEYDHGYDQYQEIEEVEDDGEEGASALEQGEAGGAGESGAGESISNKKPCC